MQIQFTLVKKWDIWPQGLGSTDTHHQLSMSTYYHVKHVGQIFHTILSPFWTLARMILKLLLKKHCILSIQSPASISNYFHMEPPLFWISFKINSLYSITSYNLLFRICDCNVVLVYLFFCVYFIVTLEKAARTVKYIESILTWKCFII